ncbi:response regulator [Methylorubrum extorquens]|uniref:Response regulator receiver protein n=1 Tax=Methylorubrum extorquens (strain CM4 / NCIMB 13688) TaxID=440085 RepID=B7L1F2_METC4|nr:response regulator [Methylorubrum extorquens]ACK81046.1 response regulator receiver protein [Methylorubrum extorquens CM4]
MGRALRIAVVVEDDRAVRDLAAAILEETDLQVVEVESGEEALYHLKQHAEEVELVFTDVRLPCLFDGVDLARAISTRWPWIKVVVTSGAPGDRLNHLPTSATYLPKPWSALDVLIAAERAGQAL